MELPADGDVLEAPGPADDGSAGGRRWSSLKSSSGPSVGAKEDSQERSKSLPADGAQTQMSYLRVRKDNGYR